MEIGDVLIFFICEVHGWWVRPRVVEVFFWEEVVFVGSIKTKYEVKDVDVHVLKLL